MQCAKLFHSFLFLFHYVVQCLLVRMSAYISVSSIADLVSGKFLEQFFSPPPLSLSFWSLHGFFWDLECY